MLIKLGCPHPESNIVHAGLNRMPGEEMRQTQLSRVERYYCNGASRVNNMSTLQMKQRYPRCQILEP